MTYIPVARSFVVDNLPCPIPEVLISVFSSSAGMLSEPRCLRQIVTLETL